MTQHGSMSVSRQSVFMRDTQQDDLSPTDNGALQRYLTRQPILDGAQRIIGYELGLRDNVPIPVLPGANAQASVEDEFLLTSVADLDFRRAMGNRLLLLSLSCRTLHNPLLETIARERTLISLQASELNAELMERITELSEAGFIFVLDNYSGETDYLPKRSPFEYARLDVTRHDAIRLSHLALHLRSTVESRLIATNVDSEEILHACRQLPFNLYQGYHFTELQPQSPHRLDSNRMRVMDLLNRVMNHDDLRQIEAGFKVDAALSLRLLRFINSPALGLRHEIQSIGHALLMLGHDQLYRWLTFLLFSADQTDDRARALFRTGLTRARLMEALGERRITPDQRGGLFLVGILSILDAVLNIPMAQALANLRLPQSVISALIADTGVYSPYLALARACEHFDQGTIAHWARELGMTPDEVNLTHVNALIWSEGLDL